MTVRPAWDPLARARRLLVALSSAAACHAAQAERSHLADDADVVEAGDCQMEATSARQTARRLGIVTPQAMRSKRRKLRRAIWLAAR